MTSALLLIVTIAFSRTQAGNIRQTPDDTLVDGAKRVVGVAVPYDVVPFIVGDVTYDGRISTADIITIVQAVFLAKPIPPPPPEKSDTLVIPVEFNGKPFLFIPNGGIAR